ncbi:MAG: efflux RND transporter permease subunit [Desulfobacterales bacterium]
MPLVFASGACFASQQAVGTAVFGRMLASTALAVLLGPVFFAIFQRLSEFRRKPANASKDAAVQKTDIQAAQPFQNAIFT